MIAISATIPILGRTIKDWQGAAKNEHFVQFYRTEDYLIECLAAYIANGLSAGENTLVIATASHRIALEERLRMKTVDVASCTATGQYLALDAKEVLSKFMRRGKPDRDAFRAVVGRLVRKGTSGGSALRAFGEMVALLWSADQREAAIELEALWNELAQEYAFSLFCAYPAQSLASKEGRPSMQHVCASHACVIPFPG